MPSRSEQVARAVFARVRKSGIHLDALQSLCKSFGLGWPGLTEGSSAAPTRTCRRVATRAS
jgi:hypothetical protein